MAIIIHVVERTKIINLIVKSSNHRFDRGSERVKDNCIHQLVFRIILKQFYALIFNLLFCSIWFIALVPLYIISILFGLEITVNNYV